VSHTHLSTPRVFSIASPIRPRTHALSTCLRDYLLSSLPTLDLTHLPTHSHDTFEPCCALSGTLRVSATTFSHRFQRWDPSHAPPSLRVSLTTRGYWTESLLGSESTSPPPALFRIGVEISRDPTSCESDKHQHSLASLEPSLYSPSPLISGVAELHHTLHGIRSPTLDAVLPFAFGV